MRNRHQRGEPDEAFMRDGREHHGGYQNNPWARATYEQGYRAMEVEDDAHHPHQMASPGSRARETGGAGPIDGGYEGYGGETHITRGSWRGGGWGGEQYRGGVGGPNYHSPYMPAAPMRPGSGYGGQPRGMMPAPAIPLRGAGGSASRGPHHGKGPRGYRRSDERIHEDVCERLSDHDEVDASDIEVAVKDAEITLTGMVPDRETKYMIERIAETVSGVHDIHNQIRVRRAESESARRPASGTASSGTTTSSTTSSAIGNGNGGRS